jgi:hypothetical protein
MTNEEKEREQARKEIVALIVDVLEYHLDGKPMHAKGAAKDLRQRRQAQAVKELDRLCKVAQEGYKHRAVALHDLAAFSMDGVLALLDAMYWEGG